MQYKLHDLIDIDHFQKLQDRLNAIYSFPSSIIDNDGNILTATAWQDICTKFHRKNKECEKECIKSDQYINSHLHEANPAVSYRCPHGLIDNATPIIIDGVHYGNFFTGQFFLEQPDLEFFRKQAKRYGFDEDAYLDAVQNVPVWTQEQLDNYLYFIKGLIAIISESGLKNLREIEHGKQLEEHMRQSDTILQTAMDGFWIVNTEGSIIRVNETYCQMSGYTADELLTMHVWDVSSNENRTDTKVRMQQLISQGEDRFESIHRRKDGGVFDVEVSVKFMPENGGHFICFLRDITERKLTEQQLRQANDKYQALLDNSPLLISEIDPKGSYLHINNATAAFLQQSPADLAGKAFDELFPEEMTRLFMQRIARVLEEQEPITVEDHLGITENERHFLTTLYPITDENGAITSIGSIAHDITEQKQAQQALNESNERLTMAMEGGQIGFWDWDAITGRVTYSNVYAELLGFDIAEIEQTFAFWESRIHPDDKSSTLRLLDEHLENKKTMFSKEHRLKTKSGKWKWVHGMGAVKERDVDGKPLRVSGIMIDIDDRKHAESALQTSEEMYRTLFDKSLEGIFLHDLEGNIIDVNQVGCDQLGYTRDEFLQLKIFDLHPEHVSTPDTINLPKDEIIKLWKEWPSSERVRIDAEHRRKDGSIMPVQISTGKIDFNGTELMIAIAQDITERKEAERELRESEKYLQAILQTTVDGFWTLDRSGNLIDVNQAYCQMSGFTRDELLSMNISELDVIETSEDVAIHIEKVLTNGPDIFETKHIRKDGSVFDAEISVSYLNRDDGRLICFCRDISDRKEDENLLKESKENLRQRNEFIETIINNLPIGLAANRISDQEITFINPSFENIYGWPKESFGSIEHFFECVYPDPEYRQQLTERVMADIMSGDPGRMIWDDLIATGQDGSHRYIKGQNIPLPEHDLMISTVLDVTSRKHAEDALRESERKNRAILEALPDMIFVMDQDGIIEDYYTPQQDQLFARPEVFLGKSVVEVMPEKVGELIDKHITKTLKGSKLETFEYYLEYAESIRYFDCRMVHQQEHNVLAVVRDITNQKQAELALEQSEEKYRALYENAPLSYQSLDENGCFLDINPTWLKTLGYERNDVIGKCFKDFLHPDWKPHFEMNFPEFKKRGYVHDVQFKIRHKNGEYRDISFEGGIGYNPDGSFRQTYCVFQDITEQKEAEKSLRETTLQLQEAIRAGRVGLWDWNLQTKSVYYSSEWKSQIGYDDHEIGNDFKEWEERVHPDDLEDALKRINECITKRDQDYNLEFRFRHKDGHYIWILAQASILVDDTNNPVRILGSHIEITDRVMAEQALRESEAAHRALVDGMPDIVLRFDHEGRHLFASDNVSDVSGISAATFIGKTHREMGFTEDLCNFWEEAIHRVFTTSAPYETEFTFDSPQGAIIFNWRLVPEINDAGDVQSVLSISRDVTAHRQAEKNYQMLFNKMLDGFAQHEIICDDDNTPVDYRFIAVNPAFERMTGLKHEEIIGRSVREIMPDIEQSWIDTYGTVALTGEPAQFEDYSAEIGRYFQVNAFRNAPGQFACIFIDITEQKMAEKTLGEFARKKESIFRVAPVGIGVITDRVFVEVNDLFCNMTGYSREELIGKSSRKVYHGDKEFKWVGSEKYRQIEETGTGTVETQFKKKDGTIIEVLLSSTPLNAADLSAGVTFTALDITDRKHAMEALRKSEKRYRNAERLTNLGSWEMEIATGKSIWSDEFYRICGYEPGSIEPTAELGLQIIHPDDRERAANAVNDTIKLGKSYDIEKRIVRPDGEIRWVHSVGEIIYDENEIPCKLSGSFLDITERKQAEQALRDSEELFRSLVEQAADGFELLDVDGYYLDANTASCEMLGYTYKELIGKHISEIDPNIDKLKFQSQIEKMELDKTITLDTTHKRIDQSIVPVEIAAKKITIKGIPRILSMVRDVSERKQAEMEREKLEVQLNQAQKMEAVGRLAGGVAHDFNNMLNVILGNTELAMNELDSKNPIFEYIQEIHIATERSSNLTRQLLAFARKQTIKPLLLNLNEIISGMLKMLRRLIGEDIDLEWKPGDNIWTVKIDPGQIDQMLANLCVNSRDAITDVGIITIVTENAYCDQSFCDKNPGAVPGEYVKISVTDTGTGMDEETLKNAFEPFYTTKSIDKGTGLGLATVYGIIKQNNGFIKISSELDHGTSIEMFIPRHIGMAEELSDITVAHTAEKGNETILLVEDEKLLLRLGELTLSQLGYKVLAAASPVEAIHIASEYSGSIHILITDVIMPEMNGRDLAKRIISMYPDIKCLFMSGYTADLIAHHGVLDKGVHFIQKPYTKKVLTAKVRDMLQSDK